MDDRTERGLIIGQIRPSPDGSAKPLFTVIRRDGWEDPPANVRPCDHPRFVLDEKWATITCGECGERIDPFSFALRYAEWYGKVLSETEHLKRVRCDLYIDQLRALKKRRGITPELVEQIDAMLYVRYHQGPEELRSLIKHVEDELYEARQRKRGMDPIIENGRIIGWQRRA